MASHVTTTGPQVQQLLSVCRMLTDHLTAYAITATHFDEEAFIACETAERLLFDARLQPVFEPSGPHRSFADDEPLSECCGGKIKDIDGYDICSGCGAVQY